MSACDAVPHGLPRTRGDEPISAIAGGSAEDVCPAHAGMSPGYRCW